MLATYQVVAGVTPTIAYQGDGIRTLVVLSFIITNSDNGSDDAYIFIVPPGGVAALANAVIYADSIAQKTSLLSNSGFVVPPKYSIQVQSSKASIMNFTFTGELCGNPPNQFAPS